ncbi:MAG: hypothetical protein K0S76_2179 [Herbinix sp.]|jgi:hypothetical protein|nr:hypothetical protein [Herbinix sp.]
MNQLRKFMYGRHGFDQFSQFILWVAIILTLISSFTRLDFLNILAYLLIIFAGYRVFSKNTKQRIRENYKYVSVINGIKGKFGKIKRTISGTKTHKYYLCPKCKQTIRVPKGKGKICITCPKCKTEFTKRT